MKIPETLKPGNTIGLVAPSFGASTEPYITRLAAAIRQFEERGYRVRAARSVYLGDGLGISTNPADAARDVMDYYLDDDIDAVFSVGGGELMNETISHLDFAALGSGKPKWYLGYSDNTNFIYPMATLYDVPGIYGPCAPGFGKEWAQTEKDTFSILEGRGMSFGGYDRFELPGEEFDSGEEDPLAPVRLNADARPCAFIPASSGLVPASDGEISMEGRLLGGCLDILVNLSGTPFDGTGDFIRRHSDEKIVWMLEACDLSPMSIRRSIWHLKMSGWFEHAAGFLIGRPWAAFGADMMGVNQYNAVTDVLADLGVPVILDCPFGHVPPMMPLVIGSKIHAGLRGFDFRVSMEF